MSGRNVCQLNGLVMWLLMVLSTSVVACEMFGNGEFESNYEMNKINKGTWLRKRTEEDMAGSSGHFFFRSMSNENEPFNSLGNVVSFMPRDKRSTPSKRKRQIKPFKGQAKEQDSKTSLFNDFPLGVAVLLENSNNKNIDYSGYPKYETKAPFDVKNETSELTQAIDNIGLQENNVSEDDTFNYLKDLLNITEGNATAKRSMKNDELVVDRIDLLAMFNKSKDFNKVNANEDQMWQSAPVPDTNLYEILPKETKNEPEIPKPVTEKGLIKVLSMLTRTFRKIMKQHNAIKMIHDQMNNINKEFSEKIKVNTKKLNDFDVKYTNIMKIMEKLKTFQDCLKTKEEMYKNKEELMAKNLLDFESQQKKFLTQQQQFYNIQKMMLAQNEKINAKQNSIAKMQNEISHRQNHFARVLKKAKQAFQTSKYLKFKTGSMPPKINSEQRNNTKKESTVTTTVRTTSVEPVTINLFSIAPNSVIEDHDQMILKEKDDKSVDDLIYKYYFNNTFIDTIIKNKILGGLLFGDKITIARNAKFSAKRNQSTSNATEPESTILVPVNDTKPTTLRRERRWINHHSKRKHRKRHHSKGQPVITDTDTDDKNIFKPSSTIPPVVPKIIKESDAIAKDPFLVMATSFCKEIGQSNPKQILDWCVEKAIRRLRTLGTKMVPSPAAAITTTPHTKETGRASTEPPIFKTTPVVATVSESATTTTSMSQSTHQTQVTTTKASGFDDNQFFPDNDELESNLKEFDNMTPDTAGNVYYEGSLHASDIIADKSDGLSDILPEFDSNSKVDIDTRAIQLQLRRKYLRENMEHKKQGAAGTAANAHPKFVKNYG